MRSFIALVFLLILICKSNLLPVGMRYANEKEYYDSIKQANFFLEKCCINSNVHIQYLKQQLKQDTVIFKADDTLWKTLGIRKESDAITFAKRFSFKYFYNDWGDLIVLVPKGTIFIRDWYPIA